MELLNLLLLQAAGASGGQPTGFGGGAGSMWVMLILMFVVLYFFMIRPQSKKQKELSNFRKTLQVNQQIITAGGIYGIVKEINDTDVVIEIANNVRIKMDKNSIYAAAADVNNTK